MHLAHPPGELQTLLCLGSGSTPRPTLHAECRPGRHWVPTSGPIRIFPFALPLHLKRLEFRLNCCCILLWFTAMALCDLFMTCRPLEYVYGIIRLKYKALVIVGIVGIFFFFIKLINTDWGTTSNIKSSTTWSFQIFDRRDIPTYNPFTEIRNMQIVVEIGSLA